jgi:Spy/CpxP family protein refolding chaperone
MRMLRHWKTILVLVLVFVAGGVVGAVLTTFQFKRAFEQGFRVEHWTAMTMDFLQKNLKLTPEQQPKVRAIVEDTVQQFKTSFGRAIAESGTNMVASWRRTEQVLTPEQLTIYRRENEKFREGLRTKFNIDLPAQ